jgi:hypothetical protein
LDIIKLLTVDVGFPAELTLSNPGDLCAPDVGFEEKATVKAVFEGAKAAIMRFAKS